MASAVSTIEPILEPMVPVSETSPEATAKWELGVSLVLDNWDVLTDAVNGAWGGEDSADKRDWLCGAVADMFSEQPQTNEYDLEETLLHVMEDEFEVNLEDDSAWAIARKIAALRKEILEGNFSTVDELHTKFLAKPKNQPAAAPKVQEVVDEAGSSASDEEDSDEEMGDAPSAGPSHPGQRPEPIVDEEGFELVQKRGNRRR